MRGTLVAVLFAPVMLAVFHRRLSHCLLIVSILRRLPVSAIHGRLSVPATHGRLSHPLAAGADGIGLFTDRYRLAGGSDRYGIRLALLHCYTGRC